jgi:hypothetical protein
MLVLTAEFETNLPLSARQSAFDKGDDMMTFIPPDGTNCGFRVVPGPAPASAGGAFGLPPMHIEYSQGQFDLLEQAYASLMESVYASPVMQTCQKGVPLHAREYSMNDVYRGAMA